MPEEANQAVAITPATALPEYLFNLAPIEFVVPNFRKLKESLWHKGWKSPSLLTHENGYKFCLEVIPNGSGSGQNNHVSVFVYLMKGEYDNDLVWPFNGSVVIELLNWREDKNHLLTTVNYNRHTDTNSSITSRVYKRECAPNGWGINCFISHSSLLYNPDTNTEYLQDDCLRLRVVDVAVYSTPLLSKTTSWQDPHTATQSVCDFTLTEFTKRKQFNNEYYSPPFYSHPHGYKLCIEVDANGYCEGKDTQVSIYAKLMRGDYDNNLQWPFEGDIVIEVLNLKENYHYYRGETISFNSHTDTDGSFCYRVTDGEYSHCGWGDDYFISHSSLLYNPDTNTEYLQDDCLRLRVVDVAVYSTPLFSKTPSWQDPHTATQSVCDFTLTEFTKRKQFNNNYYCPPFHTHTNGYRMILKVCVNGRHATKRTHISVYVSLMRGEYDNDLDWPFQGYVIVELINWREDSNHLLHTIVFNEQTDPDCLSRVTTLFDLSDTGWNGSNDVFPHSSLLCNPVANTEYLHDDCLRFRVREAHVNK